VNPALKKVLWPVIALLCGALATYFSTGCSGAALPPEAKSAVEDGLCVKAVLESAGDPAKLNAAQVIDLAKAVRACLAPAPVAADAGA
jgi:hypothetical protein